MDARYATTIRPVTYTINYTLDSLGRATAISNSISGLTPTVTLNQAFNAAGLRTELKATVGSTLDFKNSYQFDTLGRMTELIQQGQSGGNAVTAKRATFAYNVLNQRTLVSRYQSSGTTNAVATTEYSYDTLNRLSGPQAIIDSKLDLLYSCNTRLPAVAAAGSLSVFCIFLFLLGGKKLLENRTVPMS